MGVPPSEADRLPLWKYEALLWNWNDAHALDGDAAPPDPETTEALLARIDADPRLTGPRKEPETV